MESSLTKNEEYARLTFQAIYRLSPNETGDEPDEATKNLYFLLRKFFEDIAEQQKLALYTQYARWSYMCYRYQVSGALQSLVFAFRKRMTKVLYEKETFASDLYELALYTAAHTVAAVCNTTIPENLAAILPDDGFYSFDAILATAHYDKVRVVVLKDDPENHQLLCRSEELPSSEPLRVCYNITGRNEPFDDTIKQIRRRLRYDFAVTLLLHDVDCNENWELYPSIFVLEPDYLLEVTAVAECFHSQHQPPVVWSHLLKRFLKIPRSPALMIGNIANFFLDELMYRNATVDIDTLRFEDLFKQVFRLNPLAFCLMSDDEVREISHKSRIHFNSIRSMVKTGFSESGIDVENCYLEPSFYSADYGIFGRLDIFHKTPKGIDGSAIIELKSGRPYHENSYGVGVNHYTQTLLYDLMLKSVYRHTQGIGGGVREIGKYIFYSGLTDGNQLRFAPATLQAQSEALQVRNQLTATDFLLCELTDEHGLRDGTIIDVLRSKLDTTQGFLNTDLKAFLATFNKLNVTERLYFIGFAGFIAREHRLSKIGTDNEQLNGMASLWRTPLEEKQANFSILYKLFITENRSEEADPTISLEAAENEFESSFRVGDIGVLYAAPDAGSLPIHTQIFKCTIIELTNKTVKVRLRAKQNNPADFLINGMCWNIEPDTMDGSFMQLYRNLFAFAESSSFSKKLLLGQEPPRNTTIPTDTGDTDWILNDKTLTKQQQNILIKAIASHDYFLLWGPPGTGKTSQMLRYYVYHFLQYTNEKLLLLAFTNRAVEEITKALHEITDFETHSLAAIKATYFRVGTRVGASSEFAGQFLDDKIAAVSTRQQLRETIDSHRIIVSTVSGIMGKDELFELGKIGTIKGFDRVVIDEASQLTEPMLCGLLPKFKHFMLIGDHRQLPAVVTQTPSQSETKTKQLHQIGLYNLRNSLFERLYLLAQAKNWHWAYDKLSLQGRMHTEINDFPKKYFYDNDLDILAAWQKEPLIAPADLIEMVRAEMAKEDNPFANIGDYIPQLLQKRMVFIPAKPESAAKSDAKTAAQSDAKTAAQSDAKTAAQSDVKTAAKSDVKTAAQSDVKTAAQSNVNNKTNKTEAVIVHQLIAFFKLWYKDAFKSHTLGVITPFRAQIAMIKSGFTTDNSMALIDTVERYQGGARDIIILSLCANSTQQLAQMTSIHEENGMRIDRKLNVALTRARKHLIVVGNPDILKTDETYNALLQFIADNTLQL